MKRLSAFATIGALFSTLPLPAADAPPSAKTAAYQTSVSQEQLRNATRRLKEDMNLVLEEFAQYKAASAEIKELKNTLDQLGNMTDKDMLAVVQTLREASRADAAEATQSKIIAASGSQKNIQSALRALADRLALQRDEASIQDRLEQIALRQIINQRRTDEMVAANVNPAKVAWDFRNVFPVCKSEQESLREEVRLGMETLRKLATNPTATNREIFRKVAEAGTQRKIETQAQQAAQILTTSVAEASKAEGQLLETLKAMIEILQSRQSAEERSRELATEMKDLATREERLAKADPARWIYQKNEIKKEQEEISARIEMVKPAIEKLNPEAGKETADAEKDSKGLEEKMKEKGLMEKVDNAAKVGDQQGQLAKKLDAIGEKMQKQAEALASAGLPEGGESSGESPLSPEEQAIADAIAKIQEAQGQMSTAKRQMNNGGNTEDAKSRLASAEKALGEAESKAGEAGEAVPPSVGKDLDAGESQLAKAQEGAGKGSAAEQERNGWKVDDAERAAERALKGLQEAANKLAAGSPGKSEGQGKSAGSKGNGGTGSPGGQKAEDTTFNAVAKLRAGQREALSLLQREKISPEYEAMVQQYIRNLASGDLPSK